MSDKKTDVALPALPPEGPDGLIEVTDPGVLKEYGWSAPFPRYVKAQRGLWEFWRTQTARDVKA